MWSSLLVSIGLQLQGDHRVGTTTRAQGAQSSVLGCHDTAQPLLKTGCFSTNLQLPLLLRLLSTFTFTLLWGHHLLFERQILTK
jgi:hypothetical protein